MKKFIGEIPLMLVAGFIVLGLLNFIFRSALNLQNMMVFAVVVIVVSLLRRRLTGIIERFSGIRPWVIFIVVGMMGILSMVFFNVGLWDDTLIYHNQVLEDISEGTVKSGDPYSIRGLFFLYPIYKIFGASMLAVKLINYLLYIAAGYLFYSVLEINFNNDRRISIPSTILFYAIPYFTLSINVPHWDLVSTAYLMLFLFLFSVLIKKIEKSDKIAETVLFYLSILLALSLILLFYTRGLATAMKIAMVIFSGLLIFAKGISLKNKSKTIFFAIIFPLSLYFFGSRIINQTSLIDTRDTGRSSAQMIFSYNDTRFDGTTEHQDKKWVYMPQLPKGQKNLYAIKKINSEIYYNWPWYLFRLSSKSREFFSIGGLNDFILHDHPLEKQISLFLKYFEYLLQLLINFLAIAGIFYYYSQKDKKQPFILFTLSFMFISTFFGLFSEASNRYSLIFVFGLILFASLALKELSDRKPKITLAAVKNFVFKLFISGAVFIVLFFGYRYLVARQFSFEQLKENTWRKNIGQVNLSAFQKQLSEEEQIIQLNNSNNKKELTFFLRTEEAQLDSLKLSLIAGSKAQEIEINTDNFKELMTDPDIVVSFFDIDLSGLPSEKLELNFSGSAAGIKPIVEYVSFN